MPSFLVHLLIVTAEISFIVLALAAVPLMPPRVALLLTLTLTLLGRVALITGRRLPRLCGRLGGTVEFVLAGVFALVAFEVRPGVIRTGMTAVRQEHYDRTIAQGLSPINRWGAPQEVGLTVATLAAAGLPFSTDEVVHADGGLLVARL